MTDFVSSAQTCLLPSSWRLIALESIDSTNEEARRHVKQGGHGKTMIAAACQTAGRGRRGRSWTSEPGNLYTSLVVTLDSPLAITSQLSFVTGVALAQAVLELPLTAPATLKWPNDLLLGGRKAAGILLEVEPLPKGDSRGTHALIAGIGVNILHAPDETANRLSYPATCINANTAYPVTPAQFLGPLARHFDDWFRLWQKDGFELVRKAWLNRSQGLGDAITARLADGQILEGGFADLDSEGALLLRLGDGEIRRITAGDIFFTGVAA